MSIVLTPTGAALDARVTGIELSQELSAETVPGIVYVSNIRDENGKIDGVIPDGEMWFHHDTSYKPEPDR